MENARLIDEGEGRRISLVEWTPAFFQRPLDEPGVEILPVTSETGVDIFLLNGYSCHD
jgi:hypothetical protein